VSKNSKNSKIQKLKRKKKWISAAFETQPKLPDLEDGAETIVLTKAVLGTDGFL
jgi:hypothetical protein